jgi:hypothetical protein
MIPTGLIVHVLHWKKEITMYHTVATETIRFDSNASTTHNGGRSESDI